MSDTDTIALSNVSWTDIGGGAPYGFFTNHSDQYILYREALTQPTDNVTKGHRLQPGADKQFALTGGQVIWARAVPTLSAKSEVILTKGYGSLTSGGQVSHDFLCEVNKGNVPGHKLVHKFGSNPSVGTTKEDVWEAGGVIQWLTAAETMDVVSTDTVNDISTGTGARTVEIKGLDTDFNEISEVVTLLATPVTTVNAYRRIQTLKVVDVGTYTGVNQGDISLTSSISATVQGFIRASEGRSSQSQYTVAAGKTGYLLRVSMTVNANKEFVINLHNRVGADIISAPFKASLHLHHWDGLATPLSERFLANHVLPEMTDVWFDAAVTSTPDGSIDIDYDLLIVDN